MSTSEPTMFCLACNYPLDGLTGRYCPECGQPFDPDDASTFQRGLPSPTKLYAAGTAMEAQLLVAALEDHGIRAVVMGELLGMARGDLPMTQETLPSVWVSRGDVERAMQIVQDFVTQEHRPDEAEPQPWACPSCGEEVEGVFDVCWNCQTARPEA